MAEIDRLMTAKPQSRLPKFTNVQIQEFLWQESKGFSDALTSDPEFARQEIQKRIKRLVLTPKETPEGLVQVLFIEVDAKALNPLKTTSIHNAARMVESCATNPIRGAPARKPT